MNNKPDLPLGLIMSVLYKVRVQRILREALIANHGDFDPHSSKIEIINEKTGEIFSYSVAELYKMHDAAILMMFNHPVLAKEVKKAVLGSMLHTMAFKSGLSDAMQLTKAGVVV